MGGKLNGFVQHGTEVSLLDVVLEGTVDSTPYNCLDGNFPPTADRGGAAGTAQ